MDHTFPMKYMRNMLRIDQFWHSSGNVHGILFIRMSNWVQQCDMCSVYVACNLHHRSTFFKRKKIFIKNYSSGDISNILPYNTQMDVFVCYKLIGIANSYETSFDFISVKSVLKTFATNAFIIENWISVSLEYQHESIEITCNWFFFSN